MSSMMSTYELSQAVIAEAAACGLTVATAESCTGGMVCAALTDIAGSSAVVRGGVVSYAVAVKESVLKVPTSITQDEQVGVVSGPCAKAMCEGARTVLGSDIAVSTTGIAGPSGAEPNKPVGTVWFGITSSAGTRTECKVFAGDRAQVREQATQEALSLVRAEVSLLASANRS